MAKKMTKYELLKYKRAYAKKARNQYKKLGLVRRNAGGKMRYVRIFK